MRQLHGSVGLGGRNWRPDVAAVQRLLEASAVSPGPVDGRCGIHTIHAINLFQRNFLRHPDGRVDINGPSWRRLSMAATRPAHAAVPQPVARAMPAAPNAAVHPAPAASASGAASRPVPVVHAAAAPSASRPAAAPMAAPRHAAAAAARPATPAPAQAAAAQPAPSGVDVRAFWQTRTARSVPATVNRGLICPREYQMMKLFGDPHEKRAKSLLTTASVGPFSIYGLRPALDSMRGVFSQVRRDLPDLYKLLGHDGMYNVRYIGKTTTWSNHSWGAAIDIKIGGYLVPRFAQFSVRGLDALVPYFNAAGWYWGGGYRGDFNDPMHFECGLALLQGFSS